MSPGYVATCLRSVKPFYQRLQFTTNKAPRWGCVAIDSSLRQELMWCDALLSHGRWWSLPTSMFCAEPSIDVHLYMDASNQGLAVLDPARRRYIQLQYDDPEQCLIKESTGGRPLQHPCAGTTMRGASILDMGPPVEEERCNLDSCTGLDRQHKCSSVDKQSLQDQPTFTRAQPSNRFRRSHPWFSYFGRAPPGCLQHYCRRRFTRAVSTLQRNLD